MVYARSLLSNKVDAGISSSTPLVHALSMRGQSLGGGDPCETRWPVRTLCHIISSPIDSYSSCDTHIHTPPLRSMPAHSPEHMKMRSPLPQLHAGDWMPHKVYNAYAVGSCLDLCRCSNSSPRHGARISVKSARHMVCRSSPPAAQIVNLAHSVDIIPGFGVREDSRFPSVFAAPTEPWEGHGSYVEALHALALETVPVCIDAVLDGAASGLSCAQ
ncbi:hypothetical protein DFH06DRAFT_1345733 [Mycena polygramma]|nr:hypothetical protein DFH06DRAFT_1345733 [Mycena polygramma]